MDESLKHDNPNPILAANPLSKLFFCWLNPLFTKGYKGWLEESDMYNVRPVDSSKTTGEKLYTSWRKELERQKHGEGPSLTRALIRVYGVRFMLLGLIALFEEMVKLILPVLLAEFLDYFSPDGTMTTRDAWLYGTGVVLCGITLAVSHHPYFYGTSCIGMRIRIGLCSLMYRKLMRLSNKSLSDTSVGQIVNLMSNDVARFDQGVSYFNYLWIGPFQGLVAVIYLWYRLGPDVMAALTVMLLLIPIQILFAKLFSRLRVKTAVHTDERVKVMNEIISGIRIIKLYCWEKPFGKLIEKLRRLEVQQLRRTRWIQACLFGPYYLVPQLAIFLFAVVLVLTDREQDISPGTVFMLMGLVQALRLTCGMYLPVGSQHLAETLVVIRRIQRFLLLEELQKVATPDAAHGSPRLSLFDGSVNLACGIEMTSLTAKWEGSTTVSPTLEDITLSVRPGQLVAVIGPVGSGKTSLLMSLLGELPVLSGSVKAHGKIAYVSQQAWVFSGSLRQNILFGQSFDKARYDKIIKICALSRDLSVLPNGDVTLIGDRGVTLSGGQRARVSLARALYTDADIYLLDDPLAAVDSVVGRHIFNKCIMRFLKDKPRILVTHQIQLLPVADNIIILTEGQVSLQGSYTELSRSGVDFSQLLKPSEDETPDGYSQGVSLNKQEEPMTMGTDGKRSRADSISSQDSLGKDYVPDTIQLPEEEEMERGDVDFKVITSYFKAGAGIYRFMCLAVFMVLAQILLNGSDWWIARWTNQNDERNSALEARGQFSVDPNWTADASVVNGTTRELARVDTDFNLYVYVAIIVTVTVCCFTRTAMFFMIAVTAGEKLHNLMFARMLRTVMAFFDTNPVGRVLNRFSKDTGHIDDHLPWIMYDSLQTALLALGTVVTSIVLNPWMAIPAVPLVVVFVMIRRYFVQTSRGVKRLEGRTRSPVFSHLSATLQGLHTIRAMHMEQQLQAEFDAHQDLHTEAWFLFLATSRWLSIRLDWVAATLIACAVYCSILSADTMDPGYVGLSVIYGVNILGQLQWAVRQSAEVENQMISVERVLQYSRLPIEADLESKPGQKPPDTWPSRGSVQARGVSLRYSPSQPLVLKDLHFHIQGGEKIGIVGRTGAGKSSLITTLFRLAEPEGELTIDGVNIHSLGLHDLRRVISIIPQDPVLFTGSVRRNLDPFDEYSDSQLWRALEEVQLRDVISSTRDNLYTEVSEGGSNFSAGQRQLMCLARAVLGNTRILVIDEATANVDPITDELIQQTIRNKFKSCTVLTIAHRLHTVIDSDRIMVLDAGRIVEIGAPADLLSYGKGGMFYSMVEQLGQAELDQLTGLANTCMLTHSTKPTSPLANGVSYHSAFTVAEQTEICMPQVTLANGGMSLNAADVQDGVGVNNEAFITEETRL